MVEEKHGSDLIVWRWGVTVEENRGAVYIVASWGAAVSSGRALRVKLRPYMLVGIEIRYDELFRKCGADAAAGAGDEDDFVWWCGTIC